MALQEGWTDSTVADSYKREKEATIWPSKVGKGEKEREVARAGPRLTGLTIAQVGAVCQGVSCARCAISGAGPLRTILPTR